MSKLSKPCTDLVFYDNKGNCRRRFINGNKFTKFVQLALLNQKKRTYRLEEVYLYDDDPESPYFLKTIESWTPYEYKRA